MVNKLLSRSVIFGFVLGTALSTAAQSKSPEIYFYPAQKWQVSSTKQVRQENTSTTCTISSRFNNGYVVQISGNANGFTNLNIDFKQDTFEPTKQYTINYDIPGVQRAAINSQAVTKSVLVSDLRNQEKFTKALVDASVLDTDIEGNSFRFYLTGLSSALPNFKDCTENKQPKLNVPNEAIPVAKTAPKSIMPLPKDEGTSERFTEKLASEMKGEEVTMPAMAPNKTSQDEPLSVLKKPIPQKTAADATKPVPEKIIPAQIKPEPIKEPVVTKHIQSPDAKISRTKTPKMEMDFTKNSKKMPPVKEARDIEANSSVPVDRETSSTRQKIAKLEDQIAQLREENTKLEGDLKSNLQDAREERMAISSDNWDLERATMRYNEAERQIERLGRQLKVLKSSCDSDKQKLEGMLFDPEVTNQSQLAKLAALEAELEQTKADMLLQQRSYEERIRILEEQLGGE